MHVSRVEPGDHMAQSAGATGLSSGRAAPRDQSAWWELVKERVALWQTLDHVHAQQDAVAVLASEHRSVAADEAVRLSSGSSSGELDASVLAINEELARIKGDEEQIAEHRRAIASLDQRAKTRRFILITLLVVSVVGLVVMAVFAVLGRSDQESPNRLQRLLATGQGALLEEISTRQQQVADLERAIESSRDQVARLIRHGSEYADKAVTETEASLNDNADAIADPFNRQPLAEHAAWTQPSWEDWEPTIDADWSQLRIGEFTDARDRAYVGPFYAPFVSGSKTIVIQSRGEASAAKAHALLQSLIVRAAALLPHQVKFTLLDPGGSGRAFPMARLLPNVEPSSADVRRDLDTVAEDIRRIISTYLDPSVTSFENLPPEMRLNERFHIVAAADFPNRYDLRALEAMQAVDETGKPAGTYLFVHHNLDHPATGDEQHYRFRDAWVLDVDSLPDDVTGLKVLPALDAAPTAERQDRLFGTLKSVAPIERSIPWDDVVGLDPANWWTGESVDRLVTPIGRSGGMSTLQALFGEDPEGRPCVHGIIGAMPGSGKSTLFHTLIMGLATRYPPSELRLYLIDGKFGVEFAPYATLPHAEVVSLKTAPNMSRSVLRDLAEEMERRNVMFTRHSAKDLVDYHRAVGREGKLPRILLVIDEYQELFDDDRDGEASELLLRLSQLGRSAGIHMLLASQRYDVPGMLNKVAIFGNIHLRIAMQMTDSDVRALTEFGPPGA